MIQGQTQEKNFSQNQICLIPKSLLFWLQHAFTGQNLWPTVTFFAIWLYLWEKTKTSLFLQSKCPQHHDHEILSSECEIMKSTLSSACWSSVQIHGAFDTILGLATVGCRTLGPVCDLFYFTFDNVPKLRCSWDKEKVHRKLKRFCEHVNWRSANRCDHPRGAYDFGNASLLSWVPMFSYISTRVRTKYFFYPVVNCCCNVNISEVGGPLWHLWSPTTLSGHYWGHLREELSCFWKDSSI